MATIKKLLKSAPRMRGVTPVPNGPLVKKKGEFKGSTLRKGGTVKRAQGGGKLEIDKKGVYTYTKETKRPEGTRYYQGVSPNENIAMKIAEHKSRVNPSDSVRTVQPVKKNKNGGKTPAWQRKEGKSPSGGLNAKGRASLKAEGHNIKPPQPEGGPRKRSFCARMSGMKKKLTSAKTANDPNSRINKSLRKWKC